MNFQDEQLHLTELDDDELATLAVDWRARAMRGEKEAFGVANAFESELRRRARNSSLQSLEPLELPAPKPWWKFW